MYCFSRLALCLRVFLGGLLWLPFFCITTNAQQTAATSDPLASLRTGSLTVWQSGNASYLDWRAIRVALAKDFPQLHVTYRLVAPQDFISALVWERTQGTLPDVVFVDNRMQANPMIAQQSVVQMIGQPRFAPSRGWWFMMMQGEHPPTALAFVRWLNDDPHWAAPRIPANSLSASDRSQIEAAAASAVQNLDNHIKTNPTMDPDAGLIDLPVQNAVCGNIVELFEPVVRFIFGNGNLAILDIAYNENIHGGQVVCSGPLNTFLVLRKRDDGWKVLLLQQSIPFQLSMNQADNFIRLGLSQGLGVPPGVPTLLEPFDGERQMRFPKQDMSWQQTTPRPAVYLVESQFSCPKCEYKQWSPSSIAFVNPKQYGDAVRMLVPFGQGMQPHRWRIWAVGKDGQIALSEWRTVNFTN